MRRRIAIIDADGIVYANCLKGQVSLDGDLLAILTPEFVYAEVMRQLDNLIDAAKCEDAYIVLSDRHNFRYDIMPSYKANRKDKKRPVLLDALRALLVEKAPYKTMLIKGLEADDVCAIISGQLRLTHDIQPIIVSPDKDLLQVPGITVQPSLSKGKTIYTEHIITVADGDRWHIMQTLMGDTADGYAGCPGVGYVKAAKLCAENPDPADRWLAVVAAFEEKGLTEEDALLQARVARMTRLSDWNADKKEVILWQPPRK